MKTKCVFTWKRFADVLLAAALIAVYCFDVLWYVEYRASDAAYQSLNLISPEIYVIGIDDKAIETFGPVNQWNRHIYADAINILNSDEYAKPAVIAIDVLFTGESGAEADAALVNAAENGGNVVLASLANIATDTAGQRVVRDYVKPFPELAEAAAYGISNGQIDRDNIVRNAVTHAYYGDEKIYGFAYAAYKQYTGDELLIAETRKQLFITYSGIPGDYNGSEGGLSMLSFADLFLDDFDPTFFEDCVVFIGAYAAGLMDAYTTPVSSVPMNGVEIHANVLQMYLEENFKTHLSWNFGLSTVVLMIAAGILAANKLDIRFALVVFAALGTGYFFLAKLLFTHGYIATITYPILSLAVVYIYKLVYGYILETLEKRRMKGVFGKYVDPKLVDTLMENSGARADEIGVKKDIAVLFVDVRGFTPMSEALAETPEVVVGTLNEYLELTASSVFNNGGSVDKFIGDATMALFNGFVPLDDYVFLAVKSALDMVAGAEAVNASIKEKYGVDIGFGVGINCGSAIVGNLGPSFRKDYTAIGDVVNVAARLESNAKRSQVLISRNVYDRISDRIEAESVGEMPLKGKAAKIEVFAVTGIV